jgi:hypothetical protein
VRNLIFVLFLAICTFAVVGWFLNWYDIVDVQQQGGRHRLQIDIDTQKIRQDLDRGQTKFKETLERVQQGTDVQQVPAPLSQLPVERGHRQ